MIQNSTNKIVLLSILLITLFIGLSCRQTLGSLHHLRPVYPHHSKSISSLQTHDLSSYSSGSSGIGSILAGFVLGPILFISAFIVIWYNQKKAALDYRRISLAGQICKEVNPQSQQSVNSANDNLLFVSGQSSTKQIIGDRLSGIQATNSIKIVRKVQVKQWRATTTNRNNQRQVDYHLGWQTSNQENVEGRHNDPSNWFIKSQDILNQQCFVGKFRMSETQQKQCNKAETLYPNQDHSRNIMRNCNRQNQPMIQGEYIIFPPPFGGSYEDHGALRISYHRCPTGPISLMAKGKKDSFEPFNIAAYQSNGSFQRNELPGCCCLSNCYAELLKPIEEIDFVEEEQMSSFALIDKQLEKSACYAKIIRAVGFFMIVFGICLFFSPITTILGYIPLVGGILSSVVGWAIFIGAFIVAIPLFLIAISLSWLFFHPKVGLIIIGAALIILGIIIGLNYGLKGGAQQHVAHLGREFHAKFV